MLLTLLVLAFSFSAAACGDAPKKKRRRRSPNASAPSQPSQRNTDGTISVGSEMDGLEEKAKPRWRTNQATYLVKGGPGNSILAAEDRNDDREHEFQRRIKIGKILPLDVGVLVDGEQVVSVKLKSGVTVQYRRAMTVLEGPHQGERGRIRKDHLSRAE